MKRMISVLLCAVLLLPIVSALPLQASAATTIEHISLTLEYPEAGKAPAGAVCNGRGYSVWDVEWFDRTDDRYLQPGDKIREGHQYEAVIWVEADDGYEFKAADDNTPAVTATVNNKDGNVAKAYEYKAWAMVTVTCGFSPVPAKGWIKSVELTIPAPTAGAEPFYGKIDTATYVLANVYFNGYTDPKMLNGISWYNAANAEQLDPAAGEVFAPQTSYKFHCLIHPKEGYRMTEQTTVRVNGESAKVSLDYDSFLTVSYVFPATEDTAHVHTPSEWRTTGAYHYKACTSCGDFLEQEDHYGGKASCVDPGVCTACGYAYLEASEDYHLPDTSKWLIRGDMYHFHKCSICGAHCDIEDHKWSPKPHVADAKGHAYQCAVCKGCDEQQPHTPGPEATETTPQICTQCDYIITPAKNHTHELTLVPAAEPTCVDAGTAAYYTCSGCSVLFSDAEGKNPLPADAAVTIPPLGHTTSDDWGFDAEYHWRTCTACGEMLAETRMLHDTQEGKCPTCSYTIGEEIIPAETKPVSADTDKQDRLPSDPNSWIIMVAVAVLGLGIGVGAALLIARKKKS